MTHVSLGPDGFKLDGREAPLVAAQFEYFRHNALWWPRTLDAIKEAGIDLVSIFICWDFHEPTAHDFDFTGRTNDSRNLAGFLEMCAEKQLLVLVRPGPIIDAEWETRGPARDVMTLDRLHPRFLERTREYVNAVCEVLAPAQVTAGGPVALLGVDNEILYPYNTPQSQFGVDGDVYIPYDAAYYDAQLRDWLTEEHGTIEVLNAACGTEFGAWSDIRGPRYEEDPPGYSFETFRFLNAKIREFTWRCRDFYKQAGMVVPTYTNMKQLLGYIDWTAVAPELDSIGMNLCMPRDLLGDQALVANWWYRLHRARFSFPWAAEFQSGWIGLDDEFGFISEDHSEYMPMAAQAAGLRGLNFYMFVERDDWSYAPVNLTGKIRRNRFERFQKVVASYRGIGQMDQHIADVGLLWSLEDHQSTYMETDRDWSTLPNHWLTADEAKASPDWWATFRALVGADVDFRLWIPGVSPGEVPKILVHAGLPVTSGAFMKALTDLLDTSGLLVEVSGLPTRTLAGVEDHAFRQVVAKARSEGKLVPSSPEGVVAAVKALGARRYAWSGAHDVWTFVYEASDESVVLGVWNPRDCEYHGNVWLNPMLFDSSAAWSVEEPRIHTRADLEGIPDSFDVELRPHSARVYRFVRR